eukprot:scaffold16211_cov149-Skeletonema_marinoi.AAC.2
MARSRHQQHNDEEESNNNNREGASSFEQLSTQVRSNGVGYLAGVTKLHELLAPHASLVKSYRNHTSAATAANNSNTNTNGANAGSSDATTNNNNGQQQPTQQSSELASFNPNSSEIVKMATSNMYAARVEKRLAVERREILMEMIRLEEEGLDGGGGGIEEEGDSNKRKR